MIAQPDSILYLIFMLITFEGGEGSGKTTQIQRLRDALLQEGYTVIATREPGGTPIGDAIRKILLDAANLEMTAECEVLLYAAARAQHVRQVIKPALQAEQIVLCDRFIDATRVYQGAARGLSLDMIERLEKFSLDGVVVQHTILIDIPADAGLTRARRRLKSQRAESPDEGRFEAETVSFHEKVRQGYLELAKQDENKYFVIDGSTSIDEQSRLIRKKIKSWLHAESSRV